MSDFVRPDEFYYINAEGADGAREWILNAKYDSADYVPRLGHWMLKIYDDEAGLVTLHVDEPTALRVVAYASLPVRTRPFLFKSEYDGYLASVEKMMDNWNG